MSKSKIDLYTKDHNRAKWRYDDSNALVSIYEINLFFQFFPFLLSTAISKKWVVGLAHSRDTGTLLLTAVRPPVHGLVVTPPPNEDREGSRTKRPASSPARRASLHAPRANERRRPGRFPGRLLLGPPPRPCAYPKAFRGVACSGRAVPLHS